MIINIRVQRPVGQGFFHTGLVGTLTNDAEGNVESTSFRYVYDCGAMSDYDHARDREVDDWHKTLQPDEPIDILFISHAHADHINGVADLLTGHRALTIMIPLLSHEDRIAALARTLADDAAAATDFYRSFIANPATALGTFQPDRIIFVRPGEGGAPGSGDGLPLDPVPDGGRRPEEKRQAWKAVGRDGPRPFDMEDNRQTPGGSATTIELMSDSCAMMILTPTVRAQWLLAPYVDPGVLADRTAFLDELASRLKITRAQLEARIASPVERQNLITKNGSELKAAYDALGYNLNLTSLCLYSGPAEDYVDMPMSHCFEFGSRGWNNKPKHGIGWLATGDAALKEKERRDDLLDHFGDHLRRVVTMTLPHHGSEGNFHAELLDSVDPEFCVAAADKIMKWRHPGSRVVQLVASAGKLLFVATSAKLSTFEEHVTLGPPPVV